MVRVIVLALLLANLLYFGWAEWIGVPAPPPPSSIAGLPRLKLLNDLPPAERAALAQKTSIPKPPPVCVSVGPFDDAVGAAKAVAVLQAKSFSPQQRTAQSPAIKRFWVYLGGFANDAAVTRALHTLEHGGIDDAEAMPPDASGRQISLGLFSDRAHAERRAKAVRKMGLEPKVDQRTVPGTVYWLDLTLPNSSVSVPLKDVSDVEPGGGGFALSVQPCPSGTTAPPLTPPTGSPTPATLPPRSASQAAPPFPAVVLPQCKPRGHGPVPCIAAESRDRAHPSVL
ncbi:MAG: SPOR domain-containing protein [Proteobacteria bacterium]|nr:SPOR domain-containing protein [Pseudomonadota bacterium]